MVRHTYRLTIALAAAALCAAAQAQNSSAGNTNDAIIGPPQLKDFSIQPRERIVTQPEPRLTPVPPPATNRVQPRPAEPTRTAPAETRADRPATPAPAPSEPSAQAPATETTPFQPSPVPAFPAEPAPDPAAGEPVVPPPAGESAFSWWWLALPAALLALLAIAALRRRRKAGEDTLEEPAPAAIVAAPPKPRLDPALRPWLELSLKAERAAFTDEEAEIAFELEIANKGASEARNLRIDVKMFNAGAEQDKEIGAFFRKAGRQESRLKLPRAVAGANGIIRATVGMKRDEIRAMRLDQRLLFVPVVAVNVLYDYGEGHLGQTSRSYLVGRETEPNERMGAFRVDLGPRVWRTIGQREHKLARRV